MDAEVWIEALRRYLVPALPGRWEVAGDSLACLPVGWTARCVVPQSSDREPGFYLTASVQLLAVPSPETYSCGLRLGFWRTPSSLAGYEPVMVRVAEAIVARAVPFFDRYGTVEGYLTHLRARVTDLADLAPGQDWADVTIDEELTYAQLILDDMAAAETAAGYAERAAEQDRRDPDPLEWIEEAATRVRTVMAAARRGRSEALAMLAATARATAAQLWLPEPTL